MKDKLLEIESFDLFHYAFIVPSEWEEEMRDDIIRPIFLGYGVDFNYSVALSWYLKAAEQGHLKAKNNFVVLYGRINGVEQEYDVARECFMKAAEGRNVESAQNYIDSTRWFKRSAENGYEPARVYIDQVKARKLESQLLLVDINAETKLEPEPKLTELKREVREAKEQIAILLAKLAIKDSEIENFTRYANADVPQVIHIPSTGIIEAGLVQGGKDEEIRKQNRRKKPLKLFLVYP
ncbi:hypothetical protein MFLAVUS_006796 [Mucor flavus]|uniref:Sel1 repeat family protein n=1 Tax=Mucor flavus TaxID=439312 RepID=A0ABP9Z2I3_9FUNG